MPATSGVDAKPNPGLLHAGWTAELPAGLQAAEDARCTAMLAGDTGALARLLADDLAYTHSNGQTDDKRAYLEALEQGDIRYLGCFREDARCLRVDEHALVRGVMRLQGSFHGQPLAIRIHYLAVWVQRAGEWQLIAWSSTRLPSPPS